MLQCHLSPQGQLPPLISKIAEDVSGERRIYIDNTIKIIGQDKNKFVDNENVEEETTENEQ